MTFVWRSAHPEAALEDRAAAWRETQTAAALGACESTRRWGVGCFEAKRELLMSRAASARAQYREGGNQPRDLKTPKAVQKAPRKGMKAAKLEFTATTLDGTGNGRVGAYREAVRTLNSGGGPATTTVVAPQFFNEDGNVCETLGRTRRRLSRGKKPRRTGWRSSCWGSARRAQRHSACCASWCLESSRRGAPRQLRRPRRPPSAHRARAGFKGSHRRGEGLSLGGGSSSRGRLPSARVRPRGLASAGVAGPPPTRRLC